ncbi:autophagy-related protein 8C-like [Platysternon megacephalum]|uniref:Autophagy-related protein 8C-like n=1 Tax=Platysternon megacephalum TaxID=55544 RepID=A0A4D9DBZ7_9SAUR|nr:autophagy-related protein 8C-like [Platysternon megacephalum]
MPLSNPSHTTSVIDRRESSARSYCRWFPHTLTRATGSLVYDETGREYLDFLAGAGALNYGHNHPALRESLLEYVAGDGIVQSLDLTTAAKREFLEEFEDTILRPRSMKHRVQFTGPTGANAVESALKLARKVTGRTNVVAFTRGFHGCSLGALAATSASHFRSSSAASLHGVIRAPFDGYFGPDVDTADMLTAQLRDPSGGLDAPAAFLLETVQGEGGLNTASKSWLRKIAALAHEVGALLIVDDIQAECGRTGTFFSTEDTGVTPDLIVLSKSLSGYGLPMSIVLISPEHDEWLPAEHNGTFRGNGMAMVTATAALRTFWRDDSLTNDVKRRSAVVRERLTAMSNRIPGSVVKGRGMFLGIDVVDPDLASQVRRFSADHGLLIESCGPRDEVVKVLAPLTTTETQLRHGLDIIDQALGQQAHSSAA